MGLLLQEPGGKASLRHAANAGKRPRDSRLPARGDVSDA
jgi:hypothetical protein